jgi:hypothetical protein
LMPEGKAWSEAAADERRNLCACTHHRRVHLFRWPDDVGSCLHLDSVTGQYCLCDRYRTAEKRGAKSADGLERKSVFSNVAEGMKCR